MEALGALEQKIRMLVGLVTELKERNAKLQSDNDAIRSELEISRTENVRLIEQNRQLESENSTLENSMVKGSETINELSEERSLTLSAVDDLIRSISSFAEQTTQL